MGNVVRGDDKTEAIKNGIQKALSIEGVEGTFIIYDDKVGKAGKIPKIISIKDNP